MSLTGFLKAAQDWPLHPLFEIAAYVLAYRYYLRLRGRSRDPFSSEQRLWILVGAAGGALIFSRFLAVLENPGFFSDPGWRAWALLSNKTIVGGLLGGLLGVELVKKILGLKASSGDLMAYPLLLGMILGRIGCFFAGLHDATYGAPTDLPWGVDWGDGIHRHPSNLYEILFLAALWLGLRGLEGRRALADGMRFKLFMVAYLGFRFAAEFLKPIHPLAFGLSAIQLACLAGLLYYAPTLLRPERWFVVPSGEAG